MDQEKFVEHVREALRLLYEPDRLRQSPLAELFGVANRLDTYSLLQNIIIEAIESLEPQADEPHQSRAWEIYGPLFYRYLQQMTQQQAARQLGMSIRHLRRKEHAAIEVLAGRLWRQFDLDKRLPSNAVGAPSVADELAWLKETPPTGPIGLVQVLPELLRLSEPLAARYDVRIEVADLNALPGLAVHEIALTQTLLNLLSVAIHQAAGGDVILSARASPTTVEVRVQARPLSVARPISDNDAEGLSLAHQLTELCDGRLIVAEEEPEGFTAALTLPIFQHLSVLVIDDNADTLDLLQRYTTGTRYHLITTRDPEQAVTLAVELSPRIIVLDVMMPRVDGWRVLAQLHQHPLTAHIPVIVCTILAHEEMALSLGASDFVRKPVTRQTFLAALERQAGRIERGSR